MNTNDIHHAFRPRESALLPYDFSKEIDQEQTVLKKDFNNFESYDSEYLLILIKQINKDRESMKDGNVSMSKSMDLPKNSFFSDNQTRRKSYGSPKDSFKENQQDEWVNESDYELMFSAKTKPFVGSFKTDSLEFW